MRFFSHFPPHPEPWDAERGHIWLTKQATFKVCQLYSQYIYHFQKGYESCLGFLLKGTMALPQL